LRLQHGARDDVLAGDQFDLLLLARDFARDGRGEIGVGRGERVGEEVGGTTAGSGRGRQSTPVR
jgi:hypothetical protein